MTKVDGTEADDNEVDAIWLARYAQAVDRGERDFLGVYQRKLAEKAERRRKKVERRKEVKARKEQKAEQAKAKQVAIKEAIRSLGKCCGVLREPDKRRAICPKCGVAIKLPKLASAPVAPEAPKKTNIQACYSPTMA